MKEIILIKPGELMLKGLNKKDFEKKLIKDIKAKINGFGSVDVKSSQSVISVEPLNKEKPIDDLLDVLKNIFGIASISKFVFCKKNMDDIKKTAKEYLSANFDSIKTFKVETKRADKSFPLSSYEVSAEIGEFILNEFKNLTVNVHSPDLTVYVEIRNFGVYIGTNPVKGIGGLPYGSCGKVLSLISGGIDSPVASFMLAKRGATVMMLHFVSPPYTNERALDKVRTLTKKLNKYMSKIVLNIVSITEIQESIKEHCKEDLFTIIMRRFMMKIAEKIALENNCKAIVTGESLGQVASQTLCALLCTNAACNILPILRPLIGMDKEEIVTIAKKINISLVGFKFEVSLFTFALSTIVMLFILYNLLTSSEKTLAISFAIFAAVSLSSFVTDIFITSVF